jgi:ArsR family transcriptional regulator, arsenate/arsenite/antimonite-responsive transcriptional repressor
MDDESAISALSALAQPTRLAVFRLLISREPDGVPAGEIAQELRVPHNTMSTHLSILARAGLVFSTRHSRSIVYQASLDQLREMVTFLLKDCCGGRPEICAPLIAELNPCFQPKGGSRHVRAQK